MVALFVVLGIVLILIIWYISANNKLVALENNRDNAFADIDVQLKQRHDLIPQLIGAVKGYMDHEKEILIRVTAARTGAVNAQSINDKVSAEIELGAAMSAFNIQVEAYPDLKANSNFIDLQSSLNEVEEQISASRRAYNAAVMEYNKSMLNLHTSFTQRINKDFL